VSVLGRTATVFLRIVAVENQDAATMHRHVMDSFKTLSIRAKITAFGSDGAAAMVGTKSGLAALLKKSYPTLLAFHCTAHRSSLAAKDSMNEHGSFKMLESLLNNLKTFFSTPKRQTILKEATSLNGLTFYKLLQSIDSRWLSRHDAVHHLVMRYVPVIDALQTLVQNGAVTGKSKSDTDTASEAQGFLDHLLDYGKAMFAFGVLDILAVLKTLNLAFQKDDILFSAVKIEVETAMDMLTSKFKLHASAEDDGPVLDLDVNDKTDAELCDMTMCHYLAKFFANNVLKAKLEAVTPALTTMECVHAKNETLRELHYLAYAVHNSLLKRFPDNVIIEAFAVLNPAEQKELSATSRSQHITTLVKHFQLTREDFATELDTAHARMHRTKPEDLTFSRFWVANADAFPMCFKVASAAMSIPTNSCAAERGFAQEGIIKNNIRASMLTSTLDKIMFIKLNGPQIVDWDPSKAHTMWLEKRMRRPGVLSS